MHAEAEHCVQVEPDAMNNLEDPPVPPLGEILSVVNVAFDLVVHEVA